VSLVLQVAQRRGGIYDASHRLPCLPVAASKRCTYSYSCLTTVWRVIRLVVLGSLTVSHLSLAECRFEDVYIYGMDRALCTDCSSVDNAERLSLLTCITVFSVPHLSTRAGRALTLIRQPLARYHAAEVGFCIRAQSKTDRSDPVDPRPSFPRQRPKRLSHPLPHPLASSRPPLARPTRSTRTVRRLCRTRLSSTT
jgi:hypothetical protein